MCDTTTINSSKTVQLLSQRARREIASICHWLSTPVHSKCRNILIIFYSPATGGKLNKNIKYKIKEKSNLTNKKVHKFNQLLQFYCDVLFRIQSELSEDKYATN